MERQRSRRCGDMDHLGFILGSYLVGVFIPIGFAVAAWRRLAGAKVRLATFDSRPLRARNTGAG